MFEKIMLHRTGKEAIWGTFSVKRSLLRHKGEEDDRGGKKSCERDYLCVV